MYEWMKGWVLFLLQVPPHPPEEPAGTHDSVEIVRASPHFLSYLMFSWAIGMVVLVAGMLVPAGIFAGLLLKNGLGWMAAGEVVLALGIVTVKTATFYVTTRLNYELRWYIITDRSLRIREGVWQVREVTLTYANIQNLTVDQGPLQRWFGIADVIVQTAGGGAGAPQGHGVEMGLAHHGVLRGIDNAVAVRERIQARLRAYREAGLGDPEDARGGGAKVVEVPGDGVLEALREVRVESRELRRVVGA